MAKTKKVALAIAQLKERQRAVAAAIEALETLLNKPPPARILTMAKLAA